MLVEDEISIMEATQMALEMHDFEVMPITDAKNIFDQVDSFKPDIILMDFNMGSLNGRKICDQIKSNPTTAQIKVLLFTAAVTDDAEFKNPLFANFDGYVAKPYSIDDLINKVSR